MPFKPAEQVKCPKCGKSVYAAEERAVGELKFHKECYKCSMCNKMLDSTNINIHETVLYCKTCHGRKFGPKGYGFGGGAAGLSMDTGSHLDYGRDDKVKEYKAPKAAPGEGCPRCGGKVFAAEEMFAKGKVYHKTCFNCKTCRKPLDSVNHCDAPDSEVYCKVCYGKKYGPKGYGYGHGAGTLTSSDPEANPLIRSYGNPDAIIKPAEGEEACPRCGGKVFNAEMMLAKGRPFHKRCFKCRVCKRPLDSMVHCDGPDSEIYCKLCYAKKYGPKGYGFAAGSGGVLVAENIPGGEEQPAINAATGSRDVALIKAAQGEGCPRCGGKVFMAEEIFARGRSWHKSCYSCCHCHRPLDSVVGCDAPDGEVYCKLCYAKRYGPKGYGFCSGGGGVLVAENIGGAEEDKKSQIAFTCLDVSKIRAAEGEGCPRCGGKVFMAEEIHARGRSWHKRCYSCCHCHRPLDSVVGCDAPDGEVYCKLCYAKKYGPKGYGFASGSGGVLTAENIPGGETNLEVSVATVAIDTSAIQAAPGEGCPRCGGKVFTAEEMLSRGNKWHKRCFNCCDCHRPLDSMVLCDGPDGEIYCKLCYAKKFGPKGYGFASGQGGVLFPESLDVDGEDVRTVGSAPSYATQRDIKQLGPAKEGQSRCPRCGGAVFQAESMTARNKEWHKQCYNCVECHRPLDSMIGCDAPDGEIYCKLCYAKRHGPKGYGYGHTATLVSLGTDDGTPIPHDIRQFGFGVGKAKEFLEGTTSMSAAERQERQERFERQESARTQQMQRTIVNQIKTMPQPGRIPRGVEEADKSKLPWLTEEGGQKPQEGVGHGFKGFPAKKMTKAWKEVLPEEETTTVEGGRTIITTKRVVRHVQETSSVQQAASSSESHHISSSSTVQVQEQNGREKDDDEVFENDTEHALRPPPSTLSDDDSEVETLDLTTQTSPLPPHESASLTKETEGDDDRVPEPENETGEGEFEPDQREEESGSPEYPKEPPPAESPVQNENNKEETGGDEEEASGQMEDNPEEID